MRKSFSVLAVLFLSFVAKDAKAQTLTTLLSFSGTNGASPSNDLTLVGSTLYGMTSFGGNYNSGTVFSINTDGSGFQNLALFDGSNERNPFDSGLTLIGSTLYGMCGSNGQGAVFSLPVTGGTPTTLLAFNGTNGVAPDGSLVLSGSTLYGTTFGTVVSNSNDGSVFSMPVTGGSATILLSFNNTNGSSPQRGLILSGSTLYGTTSYGGAYNFFGTVFSINTNGSGYTDLLDFNRTNGATPWCSLVLSGSTLYGTTAYGGANNEGTVFSLPVTGGTATTLLTFSGTNGEIPGGSLVLSGSTLYGTTEYGGIGYMPNNPGVPSGDGTIFSINTDGSEYTGLLNFNRSDGDSPRGNMAIGGSILYGTTYGGGAYNEGTLFALALPTPEPSAFALLVVGAVGLLGYAWRRRSKKNKQAGVSVLQKPV